MPRCGRCPGVDGARGGAVHELHLCPCSPAGRSTTTPPSCVPSPAPSPASPSSSTRRGPPRRRADHQPPATWWSPSDCTLLITDQARHPVVPLIYDTKVREISHQIGAVDRAVDLSVPFSADAVSRAAPPDRRRPRETPGSSSSPRSIGSPCAPSRISAGCGRGSQRGRHDSPAVGADASGTPGRCVGPLPDHGTPSSAVNYGLNVVLVRLLDPAQFGDVALAITVVLTAVRRRCERCRWSPRVGRGGSGRARRRSGVSCCAPRRSPVRGPSLLRGRTAWILARSAATSSPWIFVIFAAGLPCVLPSQAVHRGLLQGAAAVHAGRRELSPPIAGVRVLIAVDARLAGVSARSAPHSGSSRRPGIGRRRLHAASGVRLRRDGGRGAGNGSASASMMLLAQALVNNRGCGGR